MCIHVRGPPLPLTLNPTQWCHRGLKELDVLEREPNSGRATKIKMDVGKFGIRAINTLRLSYPDPPGARLDFTCIHGVCARVSRTPRPEDMSHFSPIFFSGSASCRK